MIHIYTAKGQPLSRYNCMLTIDAQPMWVNVKPHNTRYSCDICWKKRAAKNLVIQVYYDMSRIFCKEGCEPIRYKEKRRIWAKQDREKSHDSQH